MSPKKIPLRKCVACQERKPKRELIRIVLDKDEGIKFDETGKANGRGAYLCRDEKCIRDAQKKHLLNRSLNTNVSDEIYEEILRYVKE